ncbi:hypothetical protein llap_17489 [Limosa lapponica baueri]|uniref:Uncharacterized protein n=1 Tax=Limosa lapponica baueri TaxID=1758121 RepID=A0A2I0TEJ2_LIMLA|nr:hypothetical protein llap_17489 [Limosa lapponica baueri]
MANHDDLGAELGVCSLGLLWAGWSYVATLGDLSYQKALERSDEKRVPTVTDTQQDTFRDMNSGLQRFLLVSFIGGPQLPSLWTSKKSKLSLFCKQRKFLHSLQHLVLQYNTWETDQSGFRFFRPANDVKRQLQQRAFCPRRQPGMSSSQRPDQQQGDMAWDPSEKDGFDNSGFRDASRLLGGEARVSGILLTLEALVDPAPGQSQSPGDTIPCWTDWESGPRNWCLEPGFPGFQ